jgi:hypothetical protein
MPYELTCPSCKRRLSIPDDVEDARLTCPKCLAEVTHPAKRAAAGAIQSAPAPGRPETPAYAAPSPSAEKTCPGCGRSLEEGWRLCPYCGEALRPDAPRPRPARLDTDVRRDSAGVTGGMVVLAILGALMAWVFLRGAFTGMPLGLVGAFIPGGFGLFVLVAIILVLFVWEKHKAPQAGGGALAVRVLAGFGRLVLILLGVYVGAVILILSVCLMAFATHH